MRDFKLFVRMLAAFIAIVLVMGLAQKWDDADTQRIRISMVRGA